MSEEAVTNTITPEMVEWSYEERTDGGPTVIFEEAVVLAHLLMNEQLLLSGFFVPQSEQPIHVSVICNDIFAWGCADCEPLPVTEIRPLYKLWQANPVWGSAKWCCFRRQQRPQGPVIEAMKEAGVWDAAMEALPEVPGKEQSKATNVIVDPDV